jgi:hypothetical protein
MKKALAVIVAIVIIILIILGFRSCEPRVKTLSPEELYPAFINANIEYTCELIKSPALKTDEEKAREIVSEIYSSYQLPVDDNASMLDLLQRYEDDIEVIAIVKTNTQTCFNGEAPIYYATSQ